MADEDRPIIIVKKVKKGHGGHHGGAWKVAYADFVTAMMAFFMVMWIIGMDQSTKESIQGYFQDPIGFMEGREGSPTPGIGSRFQATNSLLPIQLVSRRIEEQRYKEMGEKIKVALNDGNGGLGELAAQVEVVMTDDGLRIELVEGGDGEMFFEFGSSDLKPSARQALALIASELSSSTASVVVEGHTDARPYTSRQGYTNWELSADRANAARRVIERSGLGTDRIAEVRGYAAEVPRLPEDPLNPANRRITILVPFSGGPSEIVERGAVSMPDEAVPTMNPSDS